MMVRGTYKKHDLGGQDTAHGVADKDDIRVRIFVRLKPFAEVFDSDVDGLVGLVPRIDLGVNDMGILNC